MTSDTVLSCILEKKGAPGRVLGAPGFGVSKPVSRVLSFKTAIYLDALLPTRSSRLLNTAGPACVCSHGVAPDRVYSDGRFHAVGRALTSAFPPLPARVRLTRPFAGGISLLPFSWGRPRRVLPVILALWSPDFPHATAFRPARAAVQLTCDFDCTSSLGDCQMNLNGV